MTTPRALGRMLGALGLLCALTAAFGPDARADIVVNVDQAAVQPLPIAIPAFGGGLRIKLSKKYGVNLRADIAQGRDGHTFSMGLGEAF